MGIESVLQIGKSSIIHNQVALQTIAHNIANAGVEGYSRQEVVAVPKRASLTGEGFLGTGVDVQTVRRVVDDFLNGQIARIKSELSSLTARSDGLRLTETFLSEGASGGGLSNALNNFFAAADDLSTTPEGAAERTSFINAGQNFVRVMSDLGKSVEDQRVGVNESLRRLVAEVNDLAAQIAELNDRIVKLEVGKFANNDLRDERQRLVERLAERIDISVAQEKDGNLIVFVGRGFPLVQKATASKLRAVEDLDNIIGSSPPVALLRVHFVNSPGSTVDITDRISSGEMGGLFNLRDISLQSLLDDLDKLAAIFVKEVNLIHTQGFGLDGSTNVNFFNPLELSVVSAGGNSRDALTENPNITAETRDSRIIDLTAVTGANYQINFTSSTTFNITDTDTGQKLDATKVSLNGAAFGASAAVNEFSYSGNGVVVEFEGVRVSIQNFAGAPQKGDFFTVSTRKGAAKNMAVNSAVANDLNKVAAAGAPGRRGDNTKALELVALRTKGVAERGSANLNEFLNSIVARFGTDVRDVRSSEDVISRVSDSLREARESISGVSIDEEMVNLLRFQQNFAASARLMAITVELLEEILGIV
ncbi:MAG: flagellar hook-associated protein FlgK [bacterium]